MLPETPVRAQQEIELQMGLESALIATKGPAAPEVEQTYARTRVLCTQVGASPSSSRPCGAYVGSIAPEEHCRHARTRGTALPPGAAEAKPTHRLEAHDALGSTLFFLGEYAAVQAHLEQGIALIRLWQQQGKRQEAYDVRAPLYSWFTEGFDTANLQEARALLEELEG